MNRTYIVSFSTAIVCTFLGIEVLLPLTAQAARPLGIDTSHYNGTTINWVTVYNNGIRFAFTKASESTDWTDDTLAVNMANAVAAGLVIGPYHFGRPEYGNSATAEANHFVAVAGKYMTNGYLPPVLDLETGTGLGKTALSTWANTFCNRVKTLTGASPIIYTGQSIALDYLNTTVTNWDVWIAQWPCSSCVWPCTSCTGNTQTGNPSATPWPTWTFWQNQGEVSGLPGVPSTTDLDVFNGTLAELYSYVIGGGNNPPTITQQPVNQNVVAGGSASFTVIATGSSPLTYRWQKDNVNLSNGGHYSGVTTNVLTITGADTNDVAGYRCVVTNTFGSTNSSAATLTLVVGCAPGNLVNADFEGSNTGGVADGWTAYEVNSPTTKAWSIQTASPPQGLQYQQIQAYNAALTASAGVRQSITGCVIGATYTISGWYRSNSDSGRARVRVSPSASTDWSTAMDLSPVADYGSTTNWAAFSGTVVATGTNMTLWLDGRTIAGTSAKVGCFDSVTMTCMAAAVTPGIVQQPSSQSIGMGGVANFTVLANGSEPLSYQWQKNSTNLNNGGHYSGATTNTLTIAGVDTNDVANYRCVVTNAYGVTNSGAATLTIITPNPCLGILNSDFEGGFTLAGGGYIGNNWTEWESTAGVVIGYDETAIVHGGAHSQRIRVSSTSASSGGVYQRVPVTAGSAYTVSVWLYADDPLTVCSLGVDPAGGTNASSGVTWSSGSSSTAWVQKTWTGNATANYLTVYYRVSSPDNVKRNGYFDDGTPGASSGMLQLQVAGNGEGVTLWWAECPAAHLERAGSLSLPMSWSAVTNQVAVVGGQKTVTLTPTESAAFFRLVLQ